LTPKGGKKEKKRVRGPSGEEKGGTEQWKREFYFLPGYDRQKGEKGRERGNPCLWVEKNSSPGKTAPPTGVDREGKGKKRSTNRMRQKGKRAPIPTRKTRGFFGFDLRAAREKKKKKKKKRRGKVQRGKGGKKKRKKRVPSRSEKVSNCHFKPSEPKGEKRGKGQHPLADRIGKSIHLSGTGGGKKPWPNVGLQRTEKGGWRRGEKKRGRTPMKKS